MIRSNHSGFRAWSFPIMIGFPPDTVMIFSYSVRRYISNLCQKNKHVKKKCKRGLRNRLSAIRNSEDIIPVLSFSSPSALVSAFAALGHDLQISPIVLLTEEGRLATISPLDDVMRNAWRHCPCHPRHARTLPQALIKVKKLSSFKDQMT